MVPFPLGEKNQGFTLKIQWNVCFFFLSAGHGLGIAAAIGNVQIRWNQLSHCIVKVKFC
jgi:hypothetical protein